MRIASVVVFVALVASALPASAGERAVDGTKSSVVPVNPPARGNYSGRNGQRRVRRFCTHGNNVPQQTAAGRAHPSPSPCETISPVQDLGPTVNGIPWYLNGRGPFSD